MMSLLNLTKPIFLFALILNTILSNCGAAVQTLSSRQVTIQSNTGQPIITVSSPTSFNTTSSANGNHQIPNLVITQGPTNDWISQPIISFLATLTNAISGLFLSSSPVQKSATVTATDTVAPVIIIPLVFPTVVTTGSSEINADQTLSENNNFQANVNVLHTALPIVDSSLPNLKGEGQLTSEDEVIQELKRRRVMVTSQNPPEDLQKDVIVSHIQTIMNQSGGASSAIRANNGFRLQTGT